MFFVAKSCSDIHERFNDSHDQLLSNEVSDDKQIMYDTFIEAVCSNTVNLIDNLF